MPNLINTPCGCRGRWGDARINFNPGKWEMVLMVLKPASSRRGRGRVTQCRSPLPGAFKRRRDGAGVVDALAKA